MSGEIPRLYTAIAEWLACLTIVLSHKKRVSGWRFAMLAAGALVIQVCYQLFLGVLPTELWVPGMIGAVALMLVHIHLLGKQNIKSSAYHTVRAFVSAEFMASLQWLIQIYVYPRRAFHPMGLAILIAVYLVLFFLLMYINKNISQGISDVGASNRELTGATIVAATAFAVSNVWYITSSIPHIEELDVALGLVRTVVDLGGLAILHTHYTQLVDLRTRRELASIQDLLQVQYAQYQLFKRSNDLINLRYHDLKNQVSVIRAERDATKHEAYLQELEDTIKGYEAHIETGNYVLDTVLTSKSLYCAKHSIELTCIADGKLLECINAMDICTIFGNGLDNAIEAVMKTNDASKRLIKVSVISKHYWLIIRIENYFTGQLKLHNGLPATTKQDGVHHGFGIKSIRYSVAKYDGTVSLKQDGNWVDLKILLPVKHARSTLSNQ